MMEEKMCLVRVIEIDCLEMDTLVSDDEGYV